jgi:hypothetical protein
MCPLEIALMLCGTQGDGAQRSAPTKSVSVATYSAGRPHVNEWTAVASGQEGVVRWRHDGGGAPHFIWSGLFHRNDQSPVASEFFYDDRALAREE